MNQIFAMPGWFRETHDEGLMIEIRKAYLVALASYPNWAVQKAFDAWVRTGTRMPSPGDIVILAGREVRPIHEEIARRERISREQAEHEARRAASIVTPEAAARIMAEAGMTPERLAAVQRFPMARNLSDADTLDQPKPIVDWTEGLADDDPRMIALRKSRAASVVL